MSGPTDTDASEGRRQHRDAWIATLLIGSVIVAVGNLTRLSPWLIAVVMAGLMMLFGAVVRGTEVSADAKGDSVYYLGLLFTFVALVAALVSFDWEADATRTLGIVRNFGIALLTTIVGLAGRVWYAMSQDAPGDLEEAIRRDLEDSVSEMKGSLDRVRDQLDIMGMRFSESAREMADTTVNIAAAAGNAARTFQTLEGYAERVAATTKSFAGQMTEERDAFRKVAEDRTQAARHLHESLTGIAGSAASLATELAAAGSRARQFRATLVDAQAAAGPVARTIRDTADGLAATAARTSSLGNTVTDLGRRAEDARTATAEVAADATAARDSIRSAVRDADRASGRMRDLTPHVDETETSLALARESAAHTRDGMARAARNARSLGDQVAANDEELSSAVTSARRRADDLGSGLSGLTDRSKALSGVLKAATRRAKVLSEDLREARVLVVPDAAVKRWMRRVRSAAHGARARVSSEYAPEFSRWMRRGFRGRRDAADRAERK